MSTLKWGLDLAARRAVSGLDETTLIASLRFYGPRLNERGLDVAE
jgi:hypothetical protein